jgi:lipopolysaccharide transport system ATP-binding protein
MSTVVSGQDTVVEVNFRRSNALQSVSRVNVGLAVYNSSGQKITVLNSQMAAQEFSRLPDGNTVYCYIPRLPLMPGRFYITATLRANGALQDKVESACVIDVQTGDYYNTGVHNTGATDGMFVDQYWSTEPRWPSVNGERTIGG